MYVEPARCAKAVPNEIICTCFDSVCVFSECAALEFDFFWCELCVFDVCFSVDPSKCMGWELKIFPAAAPFWYRKKGILNIFM